MAEETASLVHVSHGMRALLCAVHRVASSNATVLISGESGTGKERIARLIQALSPRAAAPLITINCGAISESLVDSELFGHVRGAFSGADRDRIGLIEAATTGTLLLDEVGELRPDTQVKLLRVLQEHEVRRVGENRARTVDARILAATNRDLAADVANGRFRADLFYRLKVIELKVPALRERRDDIAPLTAVLLAVASARLGKGVPGLTREAAELFERCDWPGNVRQLQNAIEHALVMGDGATIGLETLPTDLFAVPSSAPSVTLAAVEKAHILSVLAANDGHREKTAAQLAIGAATLYRRLRTFERPKT